MGRRFEVVIVGAGHGGAQAAIALRQRGFEGTIALVGDEPDLPYERPALSKEYLSGDKAFDRLLVRPASFWADRGIEMLLGTRVASVDPRRHRIGTEAGEEIGYGRLIWAAGGAPRRLGCPGIGLAGVHTLRTRADADRMKRELANVGQAVVIGGGYIGLEAAAVLATSGKSVVLLEMLDRVLARVAGETLSRFYEAEHRAHGVDVRLGAAVRRLTGAERVDGVELEDGTIIPAQMVVVGIGIAPSVGPLVAAGAVGDDGVAVDAQCRTSLPDVFAVGDCALHANPFAGAAPVRLESVQNATDQAIVAARTIIGEAVRYEAVPWFWSNQYDLKLQTVGLSMDHDATVLRGDPARRSFSVLYLKEGRVIALDCVNATRDYVQGRKLVVDGLSADPARLADCERPLGDIAGRAGARR